MNGLSNREKMISENRSSVHISNKLYFIYKRKRLNEFNRQRLLHWFDIFTGVMKRVQFPSLFMYTDRDEDHEKLSDMLVHQLKELQEKDDIHEKELLQMHHHVMKQNQEIE